MKSVVCSLTAIAVALHLILGCCCHHVHAYEAPKASAEVIHHCQHHHHCSDTAPESDEPGNNTPINDDSPDSCDESQCVFGLLSKTIDVPLTVDFLAALPPVANDALSLVVSTTRRVDRNCEHATQALRAHLVYQVLLN